MSETSVIELSDLDRDESYCFQVQAFIQGRSHERQLGELSPPQCSSDEQQSVFEGDYQELIEDVKTFVSSVSLELGFTSLSVFKCSTFSTCRWNTVSEGVGGGGSFT